VENKDIKYQYVYYILIIMTTYFDDTQLFSTPKVSQYNNHMVMTNVSKETKKKYVNIDTKYCDEYINNRTNSTNISTYNIASFTFTLPEKLTDTKSITVINAEIPMTYYNISSAAGNNYFKLRSDFNGSYTQMVIIPDGQYTNSSLMTYINSLFVQSAYKNQSTNIAISLNTNSTVTFTSDASGAGYFYIDFAVDSAGNFDKYNFKNKLGWLLGFRGLTYKVIKGTPITSESTINITGPKYMYLAIEDYSKGLQNSFSSPLAFSIINKKVIAKICLNNQLYPYGCVYPSNIKNGSMMSDKRNYSGKTDLQRLQIQLIGEDGNPINLNGSDFSFGLEIEYE